MGISYFHVVRVYCFVLSVSVGCFIVTFLISWSSMSVLFVDVISWFVRFGYVGLLACRFVLSCRFVYVRLGAFPHRSFMALVFS